MFSLFGKKSSIARNNTDEEAILDDRQEVDLAIRISGKVKELFSGDQDLFRYLCGAVFALQQDMKVANRVNLWSNNNIDYSLFQSQGIQIPMGRSDHNSINKMTILHSLKYIMDINGAAVKKFAAKLSEPSLSKEEEEELKLHLVLAGTRNRAAAVWIVTVVPTENPVVHAAAVNIWMALHILKAPDVIKTAQAFTGTYFTEYSCKAFSASDWPSWS